MLASLAGDPSSAWSALSGACGVAYFALWSFSFYPQVYLNWKRQSAAGLSADFTYLNPLGFLALAVWSFGAYFSPIARQEYAARHGGHLPQVSASDLAFSLHALVISAITLVQFAVYARREERELRVAGESTPLLPVPRDGPELFRPSLACQVAVAAIVAATFGLGMATWIGRFELLDWLYFVSSVKLAISFFKYIPQIVLNYRLKSTEGFAITAITCDAGGGILSLTQLVISSVAIDHAPAGIIANPVKLGLSILALVFDSIMLAQNFLFYRGNKIELVEGQV
ncbi:hypothetical protein Q5752_003533 [Cryptotrichosporon argae]